jgi:hypothetical protein
MFDAQPLRRLGCQSKIGEEAMKQWRNDSRKNLSVPEIL